MATDIRNQIHHLVDSASEYQLEEVLEILQPSNSNYSKEDIERFHKIAKDHELGLSKSYSMKEAFEITRNKAKRNAS